MRIFVLNDELDSYELDNVNVELAWLVYHYTYGSYEGYGEAIGLGTDGKLYFQNLGHCSCFGAFWDNNFPNGGSLSIEEFVADEVSVLDDTNTQVRQKVYELLQMT